jgi:glycine/D-amino acid oxidase-like deaminating enzyme
LNRRQFYHKIWRDCIGILRDKRRVAIAGGGIAGTHLALALSRHGCAVTLFEPAAVGGVRIPVMHACQTPKERSGLWRAASEYSRGWYDALIERGFPIVKSESSFGRFFTMASRTHLRGLYALLSEQKIELRRQSFQPENTDKFDFYFVATGAATALSGFRHLMPATQLIRGYETYASHIHSHEPAAAEALLELPRRLALLHRREATAQTAYAEAREVIAAGRYALFGDHRIVTRDRLPVVGFAPAPIYGDYNEFRWHLKDHNLVEESVAYASPFLFQGMGYHAMTYAPYLAEQVALWLTGESGADENMICALTPARFLPRSGAQDVPAPNAAGRGN